MTWITILQTKVRTHDLSSPVTWLYINRIVKPTFHWVINIYFVWKIFLLFLSFHQAFYQYSLPLDTVSFIYVIPVSVSFLVFCLDRFILNIDFIFNHIIMHSCFPRNVASRLYLILSLFESFTDGSFIFSKLGGLIGPFFSPIHLCFYTLIFHFPSVLQGSSIKDSWIYIRFS